MEYVLGEVLYSSAETHVVVGTHRATGASVVLKAPREPQPPQRTLDQLRREHAFLRELPSGLCPRALDLLPYGPGVAVVMERWGESLDRVLARGPLDMGTALRLAVSLARALGQVHRQGIIHRDIKPQNVLVDMARGEVRLIDFGIAVRRPTYVEGAAAVETLAGTLAYIAPEQTGRMGRAADARADLYALGVSLYEMLTGTLPFETTDAMELIHAHIARTPAPPRERAPERRIPAAVSAIVMKLLQKSPERRYQTAEGAAFDLDRAAQALAEGGAVPPFALGSRDWEDRIRKPSRLFGRERELAALGEAIEAVSAGAAALVLVAGPSGVGKSALVQALRDSVRTRRWLFAHGKFDQIRRGATYDALSQALRFIVRRRLADPAEELARWKAAWQDAAGPNARLLIELVPELAHLLGEPPPLPEVGPAEAKARFQRTLRRFLRATATAAHPLLLFIDDLQWADTASLDLLREFITDPDATHLLLLGAYRDGDVDAAHPLHALSAAAAGCRRALPTVTLAPLGDEALEALVANLLDRPVGEARELAATVKAKTDGSPFFVEQFLRALHERRLLARDLETGRWTWDPEQIERAVVTDNVVALLTAKIAALPELSRRTLSRSACVGPRFEAALVAAAWATELAPLREALDELTREGLVVPEAGGAEDTYAFAHDRVQQAAYEALGESERAEAHLALGRAIERRRAWEKRDDELFAMLDHYLLALPWVRGAEERRRLAELLLQGGARAKATFAFEQAARVLRAGRALIEEVGADEAPELRFEIDLLLAEMEWLIGNTEAGSSLFLRCKARAADHLAHGRVASAWVPLLVLSGHYREALDHGMEALAALGYTLPRDVDGQQRLSAALRERVSAAIAATGVDAWRALPFCADPARRIAGELLDAMLHPATATMSAVYHCLAWTLLDLTFTHGMLAHSMNAAVIAALSFILDQELELAVKCVELALALQDVPGIPKGGAMYVAVFALHYVKPLDRAIALLREAREVSEREGDIMTTDFCDAVLPSAQFVRGIPLAHHTLPSKPLRTAMTRDIARLGRARHDAMTGTGSRDPKAIVASVAELETDTSHVRFHVVAAAAYIALHLGEHAEALRLSVIADALRSSSTLGPTDFYSLFALTLVVATWPPGDGREAEALRRRAALHRSRLETYAAFTPTTFRHMKLLVDAGEARSAGRDEEAARLYDAAAEDAHKNGFTNSAALALRLAGELHLARGRASAARIYLRGAHDAYLRWGAHAATSCLRARYPELFPPRAATTAPTVQRTASQQSATVQPQTLDAHLDAASVMRAAQALSGDMILSSLLGRMLHVLAENAGAERAVLVLCSDDALRIRAELSLDPDALATDLDEPAAGSSRLPTTLVHYVARSKEPVVLGQATTDRRFEDDPYLRARQPASVLAVPLLRERRLLGVIYLEHPRAADAFPDARVETVALLASQAATSVENARLYAELHAATEQLEHQVEERTAAIRAAKEAADAASRAKSDFLASMSHELRTPLNGILGYAQILHRSSALPPQDRDGVRIIRRSGEHLLALIDDVLDLARIEAGKLELSRKEVPLPALLRTLNGLAKVRADEKGIAFLCETGGAALPTVLTDEKRLTQVLLNLVGNAIKFTDRGRVRLGVEVRDDGAPLPADDAAVRTLCFRIEDTGPGIAPEHLGRIFEPFEQVGEARARADGTGLGLAITRQLVDHLGGQLEVESALGQGSAFTVTLRLPVVSSTAKAADAAASWERITGYHGARRTLLVVDHVADNRAVLRDLLSPLGFEILEADGGEQALALAGQQPPALILVDLTTPGVVNDEIPRTLRRSPELADAPILATSAGLSAVVLKKAADLGCTDVLSKPVRADELLTKLERHLGLRWIHSAASPATPSMYPAAPCAGAPRRPPADALGALLRLADTGRIGGVIEEAQRLKAADPELTPWLEELCALARRMQVKALRDFLRQAQSA